MAGEPGKKSGIKAALASVDVGAPPDEAAEQPVLPGLPEPKARGRGRPGGAMNRATAEWREYLLERYPSPLEGLAAVAAMDVQELARQLHCKVFEAFQEQQKARIALAPYVHKKMPVEIAGVDGALPVFAFQLTAAQAETMGLDDGVIVIDAEVIEDEENQPLSNDEDPGVGKNELENAEKPRKSAS